MKKVLLLLKETAYLIREHRLYFLAPLMMLLCVVAICFFYFGPSLMVSFIYAGA
jgi:hypothetical protein